MKSNTPEQEDTGDIGRETISSPRRIAEILSEANRHLVLLSVRLDPDGPLYDSLIVRLDPKRELLYLDDIKPAEDQTTLTPGQAVEVFATLRGTAIRFALTIMRGDGEGPGFCVAAAYPREIVYIQRRDIFRVHLPLYERRYVRIRPADSKQEMRCRIVDISVKGFCLEIDEGGIQPAQVGATFDYLGMELPETRTVLSGEANLINLRASPRPGLLSAGFAILNLDPQTERALMRAALYYQREARKKGV